MIAAESVLGWDMEDPWKGQLVASGKKAERQAEIRQILGVMW